MTNIAQTINVLQAMILTEGPRMVLTPTYHVYDMYQVHQDAMLLDTAILSDDYVCGDKSLKKINVSVSKNEEGDINMTLCNIDPNEGAEVSIHLGDCDPIREVLGTVLTADAMNAKNDFEDAHQLEPKAFTGFEAKGTDLKVWMPSKSVVLITVKC